MDMETDLVKPSEIFRRSWQEYLSKEEKEILESKWKEHIRSIFKVGYAEEMTAAKHQCEINGEQTERIDSFGIFPKMASMWGRKAEDCIKVKCKIIEDDITVEEMYKRGWKDEIHYIGWVSLGDDEPHISIIYDNPMLFSICFPGGGDYEQKMGSGYIVVLEVEEIK